MNRTVKDATVKTFHYQTSESLKAHVLSLRHRLQLRQAPQGAAMANTLSGRLRRLESDPSAFKIDPHYLIPGPHT